MFTSILSLAIFVIFPISLFAEDKGRIDLSQQGYLEGDIDMPMGRNGILSSLKWTDGIIPYDVQRLNQEQKDMVKAAMKEIESQSCVRFRPRTNDENYIAVYLGRGCSSAVGMQTGPQYVSLNEYGCWYHGTIVHELLHAVGLWHEQSRYDRDNYITVHIDKVTKYAQFNFDLKLANESSTYGVPYSYDSVMHYAKDAFAETEGELVMETKDPDAQDRIGNRAHGVDADYEKVRRIYQCSGAYPTMPTPTVAPPPPCQDKITYCDQQKDTCSQPWAKEHCRKTCGFCTSDCKDEVNYCRDYKTQCGSLDWLKTYCRKSCKLCAPN